jgi:DNA-binding CsgD family transcriptional regulator
MLRDWPLVGRHEELDFVEASLGAPSMGVVVAGAAGVGKTRLLREVLRRANASGRPTAWAQATWSAREIPFGAVAHLLPPSLEAGGRRNLLRAAADAIASTDDGRRVLGIDDAHLLDEHSAAVLLLLAETGRCGVVASVRTGEPAPDSITAMWKDEILERLELQALSPEEVGRLLEATLGPPIDATTLDRLIEVTRGNALFLRELVLGGIENGRFARQHGAWRWQGGFAEIPRLSDVLAQRLRGLDDRQRALLELIAAAEPIELAIVERVDKTDVFPSLTRMGVIELETGPSPLVRPSHPLYAEEIRAATPAYRRRVIYAMLAEALEQTGAIEGDDLLRLATWRMESGEGHDPDLFVSAARRARSRFDYELAERLARAALGSEGIGAELELAEALIGLGRFAVADDLLEMLEDGDVTHADLARLAITRSSNLFWHLGRGPDAALILERTGSVIDDPALRGDLEAARVAFLVFGGQTAEAIELASKIVDDPTATDRAVLQAASMMSWALNVVGLPSEARAIGQRFIGLARRRTEEVPFAAEWLDSNTDFVFSGRLNEAIEGMQKRHRAAVEKRAGPVRAGYAFGLGWTFRVQGKVRTAQRWLREGIALMRDSDPFNNLSATLAELAHASALAADVTEAEEALSEAEATRASSFRMDEGHVGLARAWIAAARGEMTSARSLARATADAAGAMGQRTYEAAALHDLARLGAAPEVEDRLLELCQVTDSMLIRCFAASVGALAGQDPSALMRSSTEFEGLGADLYAAEAAAVAARIYRREGRTGSALAAAAEARALADRCEGASTPALDHLEVELPLTSREEEIATLASRGLSNREIAERLFVSVRTVDNHLHSAYAKLGVRGRGDLAPILLASSSRSQ